MAQAWKRLHLKVQEGKMGSCLIADEKKVRSQVEEMYSALCRSLGLGMVN